MTLLSVVAFAQALAASSPFTELWEVMKGGMLVLSTMGVGYLVRSDRDREIRVIKLEREVFDEGGTNGLKRKNERFDRRLDAIEERNEKIDAIVEYEHNNYKGPDRRMAARRLRNREFPTPLDDGEGKEDL